MRMCKTRHSVKSLVISHRIMGIARSSVVCFVIDTTGSMSDDIDEARSVVHEIIDSKKGTQDEPSEYILVPFNDPGKISSTFLPSC